MKKINLILLLVFHVYTPVFSQQITQTIRGIVLDDLTDASLVGVEVFVALKSEWKGTTTNEQGEFVIPDIPVGRQTIFCRYLGYEDHQMANIEITSGKSPYFTISLKESIEQLKVVEITAKQNKSGTVNPSALISTRTFSVEEAGRYAGSFNDPARMAQSFAGAASPDDESNEIIIRGNSPRGVLWRLQGLEIPNPNHYREEGGSGGAISLIPDIVLSNSDFFTGAFPAEYGNALSGVFDLNLRKGNSNSHEVALQVGVLGLQAAMEGPLSKKNQASYLFNYRYSTVSVLEKMGLEFSDEDEITPVFQDAAVHLSLPTQKMGKFSIYGLWGKSIAGSKPVRDSTAWVHDEQREIFDEEYVTGVLGINHNYIFTNNKTSITTALSYNHQSDLSEEFYIQNDYSDLLLERDRYKYKTWRFKSVLKHKFKPQIHGETGLLIDELGYDINFSERINGALREYINDKQSTQYIRWYAQLLLRPSDLLTINGGIHIGHFALNGKTVVEPRIAANYKLTARSTLSYGTGLHSRLEPISLYLSRDFRDDGSVVRQNRDLELTKSWHHIIGWDYRLSDDWRIKAEAYYQYLFDVPVFPTTYGGESALNFSSGFTSDQLFNEGKGRNLGVEFTLEKFLERGHFLLFTSSFFDSKYEDTNGKWIDTRYNIKFTSNLLSGKEWSVGKNKTNTFGVNGRIIFHGGLNYTGANEIASQQNGVVVPDYNHPYAKQLPNFFRIDTSLKYRKNKPKWSWLISLDIQNVTNRSNVYARYYNVRQAQYNEVYQLGLLPVLNFRVEI